MIIVIFSAFLASYAQTGRAVAVYATKTFASDVSRTDTSWTLSLSYAKAVEVVTSAVGADSIKLIIHVDGLIAGQWIKLKSDSIHSGGSVTTTGMAVGTILRGYTANVIVGAEQIRVRNVLTAVDSSSATSYEQHLILRY